MIKLTAEQLRIVTDILAAYVPDVEVRAFGSRVGKNPNEYSDFDIALVGNGKLDAAVIEALKEAFEESDLPFRVDIIDYNGISPEFRKIIDSRYEIIQIERHKRESS